MTSILYVEDNDDLREALALLLEGEGREVVSCESGEGALAALAERSFDVLITDVSLPGISGTELAQRLLAERPRQRVVLCSGYGASQNLSSFGPNVRWILKPFEMDALEHLLQQLAAADGGA